MDIKEHMKILGSDGGDVGTVDRVEGDRIKLRRSENAPEHQSHHHYIDCGLVHIVENDTVKLSVSADAVPKYEEDGQPA